MCPPPTSVPANTAIYQSAVMFTFLLSVPILKERVTVLKVCTLRDELNHLLHLVVVYYAGGHMTCLSGTNIT